MKAHILSIIAFFITAFLLFSCGTSKDDEGSKEKGFVYDGGPIYSDCYIYTNSLDMPITITINHQYEEYGAIMNVTKTRTIEAGQSIKELYTHTLGFGGSTEPKHIIYLSDYTKITFDDGKEIEFYHYENANPEKDGVNVYQIESYVVKTLLKTDENVDKEFKYDLGSKLYDLAK